MANEKEEIAWEHTSRLMAVVFNSSIWDSSKTPPRQPRDFNLMRLAEDATNAAGPAVVEDESRKIVEQKCEQGIY